jgi:hypothetical protein
MRRNIFNLRLAAVLLVLVCVLSSCKDTQLQKLADAELGITKAMATVQTAVLNANQTTPPLIDTATTGKIMQLSLRIDLANKSAIEATRTVAKLDDPTKASVSQILAPVAKAVDDIIKDPAIAGIKDTTTRDSVRAALVALQTTISTTQLLVAVGK